MRYFISIFIITIFFGCSSHDFLQYETKSTKKLKNEESFKYKKYEYFINDFDEQKFI